MDPSMGLFLLRMPRVAVQVIDGLWGYNAALSSLAVGQLDGWNTTETPQRPQTSNFRGYKRYTPRKINMEPENRPLEQEIPIGNHDFQVLC